MNFKSLKEFENEYKRLSKKYKSLPEDLKLFQKVVGNMPLGSGKHFKILHIHKSVRIIKARLACRYLMGSALRIIYAYNESSSLIEFIELYYKGDKENEDRTRIQQYINYIL